MNKLKICDVTILSMINQFSMWLDNDKIDKDLKTSISRLLPVLRYESRYSKYLDETSVNLIGDNILDIFNKRGV